MFPTKPIYFEWWIQRVRPRVFSVHFIFLRPNLRKSASSDAVLHRRFSCLPVSSMNMAWKFHSHRAWIWRPTRFSLNCPCTIHNHLLPSFSFWGWFKDVPFDVEALREQLLGRSDGSVATCRSWNNSSDESFVVGPLSEPLPTNQYTERG